MDRPAGHRSREALSSMNDPSYPIGTELHEMRVMHAVSLPPDLAHLGVQTKAP